jgi:hypothetical protein
VQPRFFSRQREQRANHAFSPGAYDQAKAGETSFLTDGAALHNSQDVQGDPINLQENQSVLSKLQQSVEVPSTFGKGGTPKSSLVDKRATVGLARANLRTQGAKARAHRASVVKDKKENGRQPS